MQVKITMRYHCTTTETNKISVLTVSNVFKNGRTGTSMHCYGNVRCTTTLENIVEIS